ncbi:DUF5689 domain-containing protein [Salegentibacter sediminis]|uniref:DUF5689 domain-containing protein n=1 Tax=Salegentibacter sediminis TaxID=1930251 RepID=UPI0009BF860F|nr:DUF5689 domain-containing protein [Salegentibacter sediminis]
MKTFLMLGFLGFSLISCVKTDDFEIPNVETKEFELDGKVTNIAAVKNNFDSENNVIYTFSETETYMEAYVVSTDEGGNFYKELVLQDRPESPTAGILILVDNNSLFETFEFGRKIYVRLDGLSLWQNNGVIQLGKQNRGDVVAIPNSLLDEHLIRTTETVEITPLPLEISEFSTKHLNLYIRLNNVQFNRNLVRDDQRFTFAGEQTDQYDGERQLESCITGATTVLSSSTFSDFKSLLLPQQSGSIEGVLSRNFYDEYFVIAINTPDAIDFNKNRCDPVFFSCGDVLIPGPEVIFEENFTNITSKEKLETEGWTNLNVNGGNESFEPGVFDGDRYIRISAFNTDENPLEVWLVSPPVDLTNSTIETLSFEIMASYDNATILEVLITNEYSGNPLTTEWLLLDAKIPVGPSNQYGKKYLKSELDISCLDGVINLAFRYLGAGPDKTTTYDIDNIRVTGH